MSYLPVSKSMARFLAKRSNISNEQETVITYAIEILMLTLLDILLALAIGVLLGVLPGTLAGIIIAFLYRHTAGGAHSNSPWRCMLVTVTIYPLIALLATYLVLLERAYTDIITAAAILCGFTTILLLAPVDSAAAPIISSKRRKRLKIWAFVVMVLLTVLMVVFRQTVWFYADQLQMCVAMCVLWLSLMLTKLGHQFFTFIDKLKFKLS